MHEKITAGASACAVVVSIFSTIVSCTSQQDIEKIRQSYSLCNAKIEALNNIVQNRFPEVDEAIKNTAILLYNPSGGLPVLPKDPEKLRIIFGHIQGLGTTVDRIWRESRPFMTGDRRTQLQNAYKEKLDAFQAVMDATNAGKLADIPMSTRVINALNMFILNSPQIIGDELETTNSSAACGLTS